MLTSLLVPLDGSCFSERTLPLARRLAGAAGATLHVVHVHTPHVPDHFLSSTQFHYEGLDLGEYDRHDRDRERAYLDGVVERLRAQGQVAEAVELEGDVADELARYAERIDAGLVVMATHGHGGVSRMWLGSVADRLVRHTHLPILLVHPGPGRSVPDEVRVIRHCLVPLDGSERSAAILGPTSELAGALGARLTLCHVVSSAEIVGGRILPVLVDSIEGARRKAGEHLEAAAEPLRRRGLDVRVRVVDHEVPARAICALADAEDADMVAMATHGYGGFKRALLGSVADKVLRGSTLPLLVLRPEL